MSILQALKDEFNLRVYDECVFRIEKVLGMISEDEVWYRPNDQTNSIGHLILHLCGNVTQWIGTGVGKQPDIRTRDEEFNTKERPQKKILIAKLHALRAVSDSAFEKIDNESLLLHGRSVQGYDVTVLSIIVHVIEHFSYHTGQIAVIVKYLKGLDLGFYAGHDLNVKS